MTKKKIKEGSLTEDQLEEQLQLRRDLRANMVGTLYSDIVVDEILAIHEVLRRHKDKVNIEALELARLFHDTYEGLAGNFNYETREDTKEFDPESPNGKLMISTCNIILKQYSKK